MAELLHISVISPVYGCSDSLVQLYERLVKTLTPLTAGFEIILVNDSSPGNAWPVICGIAEKDPRVKAINLSRNFGQHYAITAGLDSCLGDWVVVMDCDLQDQPEEIPKLYKKALKGYDVVFAQRTKRQDNFFKRITSKFFHKTLSYLTDSEIDPSIANFGIYHRNVIDAVKQMREQLRWFPTFVNWVGFRSTRLAVEHAPRIEGRSSYSYARLFNLALNVIVLNSNKPLRLVLMAGFAVSFVSIIYAVYTLIRYLRGEIIILGWASLVISIWFLSGVIIFVLGIVGIYIGKIFDQIKERPLYIVKDKINF